MSLFIGIQNTFFLSAVFMMVGALCLFIFFFFMLGAPAAVLFCAATMPAVLYFSMWFYHARHNESNVDFDHAMRMCVIASTGLNLFGPAALVLGRM